MGNDTEKVSLDIARETKRDLDSLSASGAFASKGKIVDAIMAEFMEKDYPITVNNVTAPISNFMVHNPYTKKDFEKLNCTSKGGFTKKFIDNMNAINDYKFRRDVFNLIIKCTRFIDTHYPDKAEVGTVENISIYYPNVTNNNTGTTPTGCWHSLYILIKDCNGSSITISRYMQLKLKNRFIGPNNLLWLEVQKILVANYGLQSDDVYTLDKQQLECLIKNL